MTAGEVLGVFKETGALFEGHFLLSSGLHSPQYLQCALVLQDPKIAERLCGALSKKFKNEKPNIVVAPAIGGIIVSYGVARSLGVKGLFTERVDGKMSLRRGFSISRRDKVLIVEDVVTTGKSTKEVLELIKSLGGEVIGVGCIVDRSQGKVDFGVELKSLIKIDIPTFNSSECPLCKTKTPLVKPGSRLIKA